MKRRRTADDFVRDMAAKRSAEPLDEVADRVWENKRVNNDALAAVKLLRDITGIGLIDALEAIKASAKRLGKPCDLEIIRGRHRDHGPVVGVKDR
jgi:ribosomal protein L7/L12